MKGKIRIYFIYFLIMVIVIAIAIYFLAFVKLFDPYFLDPSKYKLVRYATCSLVLCANGKGEGQVDKVGCLEYEGGRCVKTCHDIQNELIVRAKDVGEEPKRFCGEKYAIDFEFDSSFPINLRSGEIQTLAKPKWVCRGTSILGSRLSFSEDIESSFRECIMFGNIRGNVQLFWVTEDFEKSDGAGGCFSDSDDRYVFRKVTFTPLIPYEELGKMKIAWDASFPAALYLTDKFTKEEDCQISETGPILAELPDFTKVIANINTIPQCKIKTTDAKGRNKFKVWSDGLRELLLASPVVPTPNSDHCAYTVLDKEQAVYPFTEGKTLSSSREQIFPALVASNGKLYLFFQDADSVNQQAGVFTASGRDSTIVYATSSDGSFASFQGTPIPNLFPYEAVAKVLQPSATLLNGHKYLAYSTNLGKGETYDIMVKDLDGGANLKGGQPERATDDQVSQFNPSITAFEGKLYLFYEQDLPNLPSEIYYKVGTVTGDRVKWSEAKLFGPGWKNPSAAPTSDGLMITYSFDCGANSPLNGKPSFGGKPRFGQAGKSTESATACENGVGAAIFKDDNFQDAGIVESGSETYGVSRPIAIGSDIFVFFDRGGESKRIFYSKYLGEGKWQESSPAVPYSSRSQVMPSLAEFGGGLTLAFSELGDNYDIRVSVLKGDLAGSSSPVASPPQQSGGQEVAKSLTVTSDKKDYQRSETIKFSGQLKGAKEVDKVKLELRGNVEEGAIPLFITIEEVAVDKEGKFAWEFKLNPELTERNYEIVATFGGLEAKHRFTVGVESIPTSKADLKVQELVWDSKEKFLRFTVENSGQIGIDFTTFLVEVKIDPEFGETQSVAKPPLGTETPEQLRIYGPRSTFSSLVPLSLLGSLGGGTKFTIVIDSGNTIKEFDEENNVKEITVDFPKPTGGCVSLVENGLPTDKLDVVLLPDGYSDKAKFVKEAKRAVDSFKNTEPFKSNFKKMNFHYVDADNLDLEVPDSKINFNVDVRKALLYSLNCPGYDEKIVLTDRVGRSAAGGISSHINQVYVRGPSSKEPLGPFTVLHEFGHSFGGLADEYLESSGVVSGAVADGVVTGNLASYFLKSPNCDVEGCPKWCSGGLGSELIKLLNKCSAAKTLVECQTARPGEQSDCLLIPAINDKTKENNQNPTGQLVSCRQLAFKTPVEISALVASDPWYKENCFACSVNIVKFQKSDFGLSCQPKSGCFLGCGIIGANLWRPSYNSIMNDHYVSGGQEFNEPSKRELQSLLDKFK